MSVCEFLKIIHEHKFVIWFSRIALIVNLVFSYLRADDVVFLWTFLFLAVLLIVAIFIEKRMDKLISYVINLIIYSLVFAETFVLIYPVYKNLPEFVSNCISYLDDKSVYLSYLSYFLVFAIWLLFVVYPIWNIFKQLKSLVNKYIY